MNMWQFIDRHPVWTLVYLLVVIVLPLALLPSTTITWRKGKP